MANLGMKKYEQVGAFMRELCKDRKRCTELAKNSELATQEFKNVLGRDMPPGHKIVVHLDEENVTHVIIPQKKDIEAIEASFKQPITGQESSLPVRNTRWIRCQRSTKRWTQTRRSRSCSANILCAVARTDVWRGVPSAGGATERTSIDLGKAIGQQLAVFRALDRKDVDEPAPQVRIARVRLAVPLLAHAAVELIERSGGVRLVAKCACATAAQPWRSGMRSGTIATAVMQFSKLRASSSIEAR